MNLKLTLASPDPKSFRAAKVKGMFDIPATESHYVNISADLPIEGLDWNVGCIVGSSGSGKSTIASHFWDANMTSGYAWSGSEGNCLLDDFPDEMTPQEITEKLSAVGLSSPPVWMRSFYVLSNGQQFRANLARALCEDFVVFDEFTSVVDRHVAKVASHAVQKTVRRSSKRFIAVSCHRDILPWLEPDWVYDTDAQEFTRGRLRRPEITLEIFEGPRSSWQVFRGHHYLTADISNSARVFLAYVELDSEKSLAGFFSILPAMGMKGWWRGHRTVVLPDYQGVGIGNRMIEMTAEQLWRREKKRFRAVTSAPSIVHHRRKRPEMWRLVRAPSMKPAPGRNSALRNKKTGKTSSTSSSAGRLTTSWEYIPEQLRK